ncbi:hypothetical protein [Actinomadura opuntiae]|uniref:hypothetical protein n=1 Tax=Actinomadura sp. OS1-43 TaxID=604315 RepID=UPI00255B1D96|nr:hypothetical protein [Actinomadura sp. OS1-43]MDL4821099.1 hypothetical protein [Actinomadura sp. OS1-43]
MGVLGDTSVLEDEELVGRGDRLEPVHDDQHELAGYQRGQRAADRGGRRGAASSS